MTMKKRKGLGAARARAELFADDDDSRLVGEFTVTPRKGRRPAPASCQRLTVRVRELCNMPKTCKIVVDAVDLNGDVVGRVEGFTDARKGSATMLQVSWASVRDGGTRLTEDETVPDLVGCGIGTRLYEGIAAYACQQGLRLESDTSLSDFSRPFWKKQVEKGRAYFSKATQTYVLRDVCSNSRDLSGWKRWRR